jgi:xylulokinase
MKCILGIDIGTTTVKAILYNSKGAVIQSGQQEYPIHYSERSWVEQNPEDWWQVLAQLLRKLMTSLADSNLQILAIGVSSQAPVFIALDEAGKPLDRAMIWMDRRAEEEAQLLAETVGEETLYALTRNGADPFYLAAKLLWFQKYKPKAFEYTYKIVQANGYINYRLTGAFTMDNVHASLTQLYDVKQKGWSADILRTFHIPAAILPDVYEGSAIIGVVSAKAAQETGLLAGIPVIAGTVDGAAAALEAGVCVPGVAVEMTGTSSVLLMSNDREWSSPKLITMDHALPGQTLNLAAMSSTGASLKWFRDEFYQADETQDVYSLINQEAGQSNSHNDIIFLPYMMGERSPIWDTDARGVFFGLSLKSTRADLVRSIMEGAAYALRNNLEIMQQSGERTNSLLIIGGTAKSQLWNQIKSDVLDREIEIIEDSGGATLGVAILAGVAVGFYRHPSFLAEQDTRIKRKVTPTGGMQHFYNQKYEVFLELYQQTKQQFKKLSAIFKDSK